MAKTITLDTQYLAELLEHAADVARELDGESLEADHRANDPQAAHLRRSLLEIQSLAHAAAGQAGLHTLELRGVGLPKAR